MEAKKEYAVQMHDITIKFGSYTALDHVQLDVKKGSIHAVLGENGAGIFCTVCTRRTPEIFTFMERR